MLEELMQEVDPNFEELTKERGVDKTNYASLIFRNIPKVLLFGLLSLLTFGILKAFFNSFAYIFAKDENKKAKKLYQSAVSFLATRGLSRGEGESRDSFLSRVKKESDIDLRDFSSLIDKDWYGKETEIDITKLHNKVKEVHKLRKSEKFKTNFFKDTFWWLLPSSLKEGKRW